MDVGPSTEAGHGPPDTPAPSKLGPSGAALLSGASGRSAGSRQSSALELPEAPALTAQSVSP